MYRPDPCRVLSPTVVSMVSTALAMHLAGDTSCSELTVALRALTAEAVVADLSEEHVLILLGRLWDDLPAIREPDDSARQEQVRREIVWRCIDTYYEKPAAVR